ncbi:hypothetical protein ILUMI_14557, partial [Ignelater luminosus]
TDKNASMGRCLGQVDSSLETRAKIVTLWEQGMPVPEIMTHVNLSNTILHALNELGLKHRQPARKIALSPAHREERVRFAQANLDRDRLRNTIFLDKKTLSSSQESVKLLYRRDRTRYEPQNIQSVRQSGRVTVGVFVWISAVGPGDLIEIGGRLDGEQYCQILSNNVLPGIRARFPGQRVVHASRVWDRLRETQFYYNTIASMPNLFQAVIPSEGHAIEY